MVTKGRHPKNAINKAFKAAKKSHFAVEESHNGHRWGWVICGICGEKLSVWSTPRDADNLAKRIYEFLIEHKH